MAEHWKSEGYRTVEWKAEEREELYPLEHRVTLLAWPTCALALDKGEQGEQMPPSFAKVRQLEKRKSRAAFDWVIVHVEQYSCPCVRRLARKSPPGKLGQNSPPRDDLALALLRGLVGRALLGVNYQIRLE
jgi:hypothetical protein